MKQTLLILFLLFPLWAAAQLQDNFSDGNFTQNPTWTGNAGSFIVNAQHQLQSNGPAVTGTTLQLVTPSQAIVGTTWEFWANLKLATSSTNYTDIYLISDNADLNSTATNGYFVRIGNTTDEVSLYRKDAGKTAVLLINGQDKTVATSNNIVRVRVTRTISYEWELSIDVTGSGQSYVSQGIAMDATHKRSGYFGVLVRYTSANNKNFYFDDFKITDTQPPVLEELQTITTQEIILQFNEPLQPDQAQTIANYTLNGTIKPTIAELTEAGTVRLVFGQSFSIGSNTLTIANLQDLYGNTLNNSITRTFNFIPPAVIPNYNELLITEIMADESPAVGLPAQEYIELYNATTNKVLSLRGIKLSDATATTTLPNAQLLPGEYVVVVPNTQVASFTQFGKVIGISNFPGLNNAGELLQLRRPDGKLIYAVNYSDAWYKNSTKREGGWSLEMIDVTNPCAGAENWTASADPRGGTPAQQNSVAASLPDNIPPVLINAFAISSTQVLLRFNERLDSTLAATIANYSISPTIALAGVQVQGPLFTDVIVHLSSPLQERQLYTLTATGITDCTGNLSNQPQAITFALPSVPEPGDVVINEVLFNPRLNGVDFVELVNRSDKYLDLKNWHLGNTAGDTISNLKTIVTSSYVLAPGQYVVLTSNPENIKANYPAANHKAFLQMSSLPSYPDDAGTIVVLQPDKRVADQFSYNSGMHHALIDDKNGLSLERIRLNGQTIASNFHSAATTVFATPGYINSQSQLHVQAQQAFKVEPQVFSPDGDGFEDFATINYNTGKTGFVATITVFDAQGREVRKLIRNELLADNGFFRWDGLKQDGSKAAIGYYIFYIELFGMNGENSEYKEKVVVGGRL
ncbi:lamin tail domain-containing protein [Pontibacter sp. BT310]|uniref:Lamin tail domain-containing protein n=1 Tax=Pontibacter populi TaxID=890055 RepID=A0ABS6XAM4_9BACT|nr:MULTISPECIES: lamin tail domain-containing protein [Pontibacter]MBJ6117308.1 lamin tail domain-containing protein [Pontibacter sp. BT310]MBR0569733.1 lamin tail domain-containing protein [Microvirga sp. STS03]MBW3364161.1 lamin tail domain-containing protein [Pontibacter populi]